AGAEPEHLQERLRLSSRISAERPYRLYRLVAWAEDAQRALDLALVLRFGLAPRIVRRPHPPWKGAANGERCRSFGVGRREQQTHRRALREAVERSTPRADGVHDGPEVIHPCLQCWSTTDAVGHAGTALVESDQPRKRRQPL